MANKHPSAVCAVRRHSPLCGTSSWSPTTRPGRDIAVPPSAGDNAEFHGHRDATDYHHGGNRPRLLPTPFRLVESLLQGIGPPGRRTRQADVEATDGSTGGRSRSFSTASAHPNLYPSATIRTTPSDPSTRAARPASIPTRVHLFIEPVQPVGVLPSPARGYEDLASPSTGCCRGQKLLTATSELSLRRPGSQSPRPMPLLAQPLGESGPGPDRPDRLGERTARHSASAHVSRRFRHHSTHI